MWRAACWLNWLTGGDAAEPFCSRVQRGWLDGRPVWRLLYRIVNARNPSHSARVRCDFLERYGKTPFRPPER